MSEIRLQDHDSLCRAATESIDEGIDADIVGDSDVAGQLFANAAIYTSAAGIVAALDRLTGAVERLVAQGNRNVF